MIQIQKLEMNFRIFEKENELEMELKNDANKKLKIRRKLLE